jgi:hypothetical protein
MKQGFWRPMAGVLLIALGTFALLQSFNIVSFNNNLLGMIFAGIFFMTGIAFVYSLLRAPSGWWAIIPGVIFIDLSLVMGIGVVAPGLADKFGGAFFLAGISLAFWLVYLSSRGRWWAIIPGGVLGTLSLVTCLNNVRGRDTGGLFLLGLAGTFALLAILPTGTRPMKWPWIPAGVLLVVAVAILVATSSMGGFVWPVIFIFGGISLLLRSLAGKRSG